MTFLKRLSQHKAALFGFVLIVLFTIIALFSKQICSLFGIDPYAQEILARYSPADAAHPLGTDEVGRDFLARLIYGTQISLGVAVFSSIGALIVGLIIGALAGYYGSWMDSLLMRFTDALLALPLLPVMILLAAVDFEKIPVVRSIVSSTDGGTVKMFLIFVLFSWMTVARLVRAQTLKLKELEYVMAAKALGMHDFRIILFHIIPSVLPAVVVAITLNVGQTILFESALSFLGLGIQPPLASWGNMLNNGLEALSISPGMVFYPGFLILLVVVSFNFLGDGLEYALDPQAQKKI
jgi:peptide/nickel transport system permease protein